ncbi:metalloregulator ArsR/SmtB family transcription factor [Tissierella sp. Yu-01]|uniref:ArsR/SmtB family transcription factor n=1 Tax=Tissierella sp. Yu-01 TaxID=3035694 RepID=UPI00240DB19B|nr:metalloregulator ArsR/SmtB family transcription factor [Tissierella sp. Yu-01]WFA08079.1 metalloregulator ArsR/SmtB family transcription factor [Tissierella sp. Yu-01]
MQTSYDESAKVLKVISDPNRLKIIDILSCGEQCACDILDYFDFTQPTLSHHMKVLTDAGLVKVRKDGLWSYYSLDMIECNKIIKLLMDVFNESEDCICKEIRHKECK